MLFDSSLLELCAYFPYKIEFSSEESGKNKNNYIFSPIHDFSILNTKKIEENTKSLKDLCNLSLIARDLQMCS
jgi:hypothetical protein